MRTLAVSKFTVLYNFNYLVYITILLTLKRSLNTVIPEYNSIK